MIPAPSIGEGGNWTLGKGGGRGKEIADARFAPDHMQLNMTGSIAHSVYYNQCQSMALSRSSRRVNLFATWISGFLLLHTILELCVS